MSDDLVLSSEPAGGSLTFEGNTNSGDTLTQDEQHVSLDLVVADLTIAGSLGLVEQGNTGPQGPPGPPGAPGSGTGDTVTAGESVLAFHVVAVGTDGLAYMASSSDVTDASRVLGVALTAASVGESFTVVTDGALGTSPIWAPGPLYLGATGQLTSVPVTFGFSLEVAQAVTSSRLIVRPQFPIFL